MGYHKHLHILCRAGGKLKKNSIKNSTRMPYVQPFLPDGNIKSGQFGSKVVFTKMRTKTCYVRFFKDSLNKRAGTPIIELVLYPYLLSSNMSAVARKVSESLKKRT